MSKRRCKEILFLLARVTSERDAARAALDGGSNAR